MLDYTQWPIIAQAIKKAKELHEKVNQTYDGKPYFDTHVMAVYHIAEKYIHLVPVEYRARVLVAALFHDVIEDTGMTYNDVKKFFDELLGDEYGAFACAEIVYACTNLRGRTRKERANAEYYQGIRDTDFADFVKICDRLANVTASCTNGHAMASGYAREHYTFRKELYQDYKYAAMWHEMEEMLLDDEHRSHIIPGRLITSSLDLNRRILVVHEIRVTQTKEDVIDMGEPNIVFYCSDINDCEMTVIPVEAQNVRRYYGPVFGIQISK